MVMIGLLQVIAGESVQNTGTKKDGADRQVEDVKHRALLTVLPRLMHARAKSPRDWMLQCNAQIKGGAYICHV